MRKFNTGQFRDEHESSKIKPGWKRIQSKLNRVWSMTDSLSVSFIHSLWNYFISWIQLSMAEIFENIDKHRKIKYFIIIYKYILASLMAQTVKNLPAMRETWAPFLGWENPLEEGRATHYSVLAWRIPMDRGAWWATGHGVTKSQTRPEQLSTLQHKNIYY